MTRQPAFCTYILLPAFLFLLGSFISADKLVRRPMGDRATMLIPESFTLMSDDEMALKFPSSRKPVCIYTNPAKTVDISLNVNITPWGDDDLQILADFQKSNIKQMYNKVTFTKEEVTKINKRKFAVFEFTSQSEEPGSGKPVIRKYTYIEYTVMKGKVMVIHLDAPAGEAPLWRETAKKIMNSVKITGA
ncbi:MAG: hypothetical protein V4543_18120 [Bacteroidota bacterium]